MKLWVLFALAFSVASLNATAAVQAYPGMQSNGGASDSGVVSHGSLELSGDPGSSIGFSFTRGGTFANNRYVVLFLDSTTGGFESTAGLTSHTTGAIGAISGFSDPSSRSTAIFANGFTANYALTINASTDTSNNGIRLWQLGADGSITLVRRVGTVEAGNSTYNFALNRTELGMSSTDALRFQSSYVSELGYRNLESFEHLSGSVGYGTTTFGNFNLFEVQPVPEMTNVALIIFGGLFVSVGGVKRVRGYLRDRQNRS